MTLDPASWAQDCVYAAALAFLVQNKLPLVVYRALDHVPLAARHLACAFCGGLLWGGVVGAIEAAERRLGVEGSVRAVVAVALGGGVAALLVEKLAKLSTAMQELAKREAE